MYTNTTIRNHVGWTWYNRQFRVSNSLKNEAAIVLRISSCHYYCTVWLNSKLLGSHESGHLPFEFEITNEVFSNQAINNLVIAVNNTLDMNTIPPGDLFGIIFIT